MATGYTNQKYGGRLHMLDKLAAGDPGLGPAISLYANQLNDNRNSHHWSRAVQWIENILFSNGRQYFDDILSSRIVTDASSNQSLASETTRNIPKPVNDFLGRYIETNISILTENRPRPRVVAKSNKAEDEDAAELSQLVLEYNWDSMKLPEKHREIARTIINCGVCWMETCWDELQPRRLSIPQTELSEKSAVPGPGGPITVPVGRPVQSYDNEGNLQYTDAVTYGDITTKIVTPFEMHLPIGHRWDGDDMPWVIREWYIDKDVFADRFGETPKKRGLTKKKGWYIDNIEKVGPTNVQNLPMWWWERLTEIVEGPGSSIYVGSPDQWDNFIVCRWFDRRPSPRWPRGRSVLVAGDQVIYDSPKEVGARGYNPRWPNRWHPYTRFVWEPMLGSMYSRSLIAKLLPKLKRVNAIDTTLIMWRRTVPIATWIMPKGANPVDDNWSGRPGGIWEYDPQRTRGNEPKPVFAPEYPRTALEERSTQIAEMESIAGTEEVLRGQRPTGVTSAAMLHALRASALASRSPLLQGWDESLEDEAQIQLELTIAHVRNDPSYAEQLRILANKKKSTIAIAQFSGTDMSDNVTVKIDTASEALGAREARKQQALEIMQYAPSLMPLPSGLRAALVEELGYKEALLPQGTQIARVKRMLSWIRGRQFDRVIPLKYDDPYVFMDLLVEEIQSDAFYNLDEEQAMVLLNLADAYEKQIQFREAQAMKMAQQNAAMGVKPQ